MGDEQVDQAELEPALATRRRVLSSAGAVGVAGAAGAVLVACGTEPGADDGFEIPEPNPSPTLTDDGQDDGEDDADDEADDGAGGDALATVDDIELFGGLIHDDEDLVITRPSEGEWRGFSKICTHEGCTVSSVADGIINCACHNSQYSIEDGSVVGGPAPQPLPGRDLVVEDGQIYYA